MNNDKVIDQISGIVEEMLDIAPSNPDDLTEEKYNQMRNKSEELNSLKNALKMES